MGPVKDMWVDEVERVGDDYAAGSIDRVEAIATLCRLGIDRDEAETMLDEVVK